jgi:iron(III) transport system substrate-binding protein
MLSLLIGFAGFCFLLAACQPSAPTTSPTTGRDASASGEIASAQSAEVQRLIAAARANGETELVLSWGQSSLGGHEANTRYEALFNRMYGTSIKLVFTPGPSMPDMALKVAQEVTAGQKPSTDVLLGNESQFASLADRNVLEEYDYTQLSPRITSDIVTYKNLGVEVYGTVPAIVYNSDRVSATEAPQKMADALDPKWRGRIASTPYAISFDGVAMRPEWGVDRMKAYVSALSDNVSGLIRLSEMSRIVTGEFDLMVLGNSDNPRELRAKGAPLGFTIPEDAAVVHILNVGVPRTAAHPNLAKLFANMLVSKQGQAILFEFDATDHYGLPDSQSGAELRALQARGGTVLEVDAKFVVEHPEMAQLSSELTKILAERR